MVKPELSTQIQTGTAQDRRETYLSWNPGDGSPRFKNGPQGDTRHGTEGGGTEVDFAELHFSTQKNDSATPQRLPTAISPGTPQANVYQGVGQVSV